MQFLMFPYGFNGAIVTDDYSEEEVKNDVHIRHLRDDIKHFGLKYPCKVFDSDMKPICTLMPNKVILLS